MAVFAVARQEEAIVPPRCGGAEIEAVGSKPAPVLEPHDLSRLARAGGLVLLALVFVCAAFGQGNFAAGHAALGGFYENLIRHRDSALVWYAAMAIVLVVLCRWQRRWRLPSWPGARSLFAVVLIVLIVAGAWLRWNRLDELPPGLWIDEALNGIAAVEIADAGRPRVALSGEDPRTGLGAGYVNLAAVAFRLFDPDNGTLAIRAVAAGLGVVGLAGLAALAWVLFGPRTAVAATAWLTVSQYHLNYSRWGCMPIMSSVVEVFAVLALLVGFRYRGWRSWAGMLAAGLLFGVGVYTYQSFRLFLLVGVVLGAFVAVRQHRLLKGRWPQMVAGALVAATVAGPMVHYAVAQPAKFSERAMGTVVLVRPDWQPQLSRAISRSLLAFQFIGDGNPRHNLPHHPLLTFVPAMLAPMGLVIALYGWRRPAYLLVPVWFFIALLPGAITLEAPHGSRLLDTIVPLALMVGIAADRMCGTLQAALPWHHLGTAVGIVIVLLGSGVTGQQEYRAYFTERPRLRSFYDAFLPHEAAPGRYLKTREPAATVFLAPETYGSATSRFIARRYLADPTSDVRLLQVMHDFPPRQRLERDAVYLLPHQYTPLAAVIRAMVPTATCEEMWDPFGRLDLTACSVAYDELNMARRRLDDGTWHWPHGLLGRYYRAADGSGDPYYEAVLPFLFVDYPIDVEPIEAFGFASWEGYIRIPRPGEYYFRVNPDSTTLTIDGRRIIDHAGAATFGGGNEGRTQLAAGVFPLRITYQRHRRAPYFIWFLWRPPGAEAEWVPSSALYPPDAPPDDFVGRSG